MSEKQRNLGLVLAGLIAALAYAFSTVTTTLATNSYYRNLNQARRTCGQAENSWEDRSYKECMRRSGFGNDPINN